METIEAHGPTVLGLQVISCEGPGNSCHVCWARLHLRQDTTSPALTNPSRVNTHHQLIEMTGRGGGGGRRVLLPPINFLFKLLQQHTTVQIWLYEQLSIRIIGTIRVRTP